MSWVPFEQVLARALEDPEIAAEWASWSVARYVSVWVRQYRKRHNMTQQELAGELGWQQSVVARLESGKREPSLATLRHMAVRLGFEIRITIGPRTTHGVASTVLEIREPQA